MPSCTANFFRVWAGVWVCAGQGALRHLSPKNQSAHQQALSHQACRNPQEIHSSQEQSDHHVPRSRVCRAGMLSYKNTVTYGYTYLYIIIHNHQKSNPDQYAQYAETYVVGYPNAESSNANINMQQHASCEKNQQQGEESKV